MTITFREAILETIKLSLDDIVQNEPVEDPYEYAFSSVVRGALPSNAKTKRLVGGVIPGEERKTKENVFHVCFLDVMIDFEFARQSDDETSAKEAEVILGIIQRRVLKDYTLNDLAIDVYEAGNAVDLDSSEDKTVQGSVFFQVHYRHDLDDPRSYMGDPPTTPVAT